MRHEQVRLRESFDILDAAEIWPRAGAMAAAPLGELDAAAAQRPTPAVPDVPRAVYRATVGVYAALIAVFMLTMAGTAEAAFAIAISGVYVAIFFAVPRLFLAVEADPSDRPSTAQFLREGIDTWTGHLGGSAALLQMFAVPVLVTLGVLAIGLYGAATL